MQTQNKRDGSDYEASNVAWAVLKQLERIGDYKHSVFLNPSSVKDGTHGHQVAGYILLINELENLMWPVLEGDGDYKYELTKAGSDQIKYPESNDARICFDTILKADNKYKIIAKRFYRFGLMPVVPTTLTMITRSQKYEKFKNRIKIQALKYLDMFGEDLIDELRKKREGKTTAEMREKDYSEAYRDFLKANKVSYDDMEDDVLAFIEEN